MEYKLITNDCLDALKQIEDNSIDAIVTDPPAGIAFMSADWDKDKGGRDSWIAWLTSVMRECVRVLKPGGHALVWALPRTSHWTATAIENAGFEIRDTIHYLKESNADMETLVNTMSPDQLQLLENILAQQSCDGPFYHVFGSGFPKGLNISKAIDKHLGVKAALFDGYNTALKPAVEHWILATKPLDGTFVQNALKHGVAGLNIDDCRVPFESHEDAENAALAATMRASRDQNAGRNAYGKFNNATETIAPYVQGIEDRGRYPANLVRDDSDEIANMFPESKSCNTPSNAKPPSKYRPNQGNYQSQGTIYPGDSGSAARFFYSAKASSSERNAGLDSINKNNHPTVKSLNLMRWLVRLVKAPINSIILDPFSGSGSTGCACALEDCNYIGIEQSAEYNEIAHLRIEHWKSIAESQPTLP